MSSLFRLLDLDRCCFHDGVSHVFAPDEFSDINGRVEPIARETFKRMRSEEMMDLEDQDVSLVSARPRYSARLAKFELSATYVTMAPFTASDGRWGSYLIAEELPTRAFPANLGAQQSPPREVLAALGPAFTLCTGWSCLPSAHPLAQWLVGRAKL